MEMILEFLRDVLSQPALLIGYYMSRVGFNRFETTNFIRL